MTIPQRLSADRRFPLDQSTGKGISKMCRRGPVAARGGSGGRDRQIPVENDRRNERQRLLGRIRLAAVQPDPRVPGKPRRARQRFIEGNVDFTP